MSKASNIDAPIIKQIIPVTLNAPPPPPQNDYYDIDRPDRERERERLYTTSVTNLLAQLIKAKYCSKGPRKEFCIKPPDYSLPPPFRSGPQIRIVDPPCSCNRQCQCQPDCCRYCDCDSCSCNPDPCCNCYWGLPEQQTCNAPNCCRRNGYYDRYYTKNPRCYPFPRPSGNTCTCPWNNCPCEGCKSTSVYNNCSFYHCPVRCYHLNQTKKNKELPPVKQIQIEKKENGSIDIAIANNKKSSLSLGIKSNGSLP